MPAAKFNAVLFDLDGTLLDTARDFFTALNRLLTDKGKAPLPEEVIRIAVANGSAGLITLAFHIDPSDTEFEFLRQQLLEYYGACLAERTRLFAGMEAILRRLAEEDIPWGIVTNKPHFYTNAILEQLALPASPSVVICPDHVSHTKPHPEPILMACRQLSAEPAKSIYIGDHLRDIQSGLNAGTVTVAAAYGYIDAGDNPRNWGAHHVISRAAELVPILF